MAKQLRVGVVGCGKIARVGHIPSLLAVRGAKVVALCDNDRKRAVALQRDLVPDAKVFTDYGAFVKADVDAVTICTPNDLHYPMTVAAFKAGRHVLCEKPMAGTLPEATRMIAAARTAGKVLHINQSGRYYPPYVAVADLVRTGRIGKPIHVRCIRTDSRSPDKEWSPGAKWFVSMDRQGGLILDIAVHMADLLKWLAGDVAEIASLVDSRTKGIDVPDNVSALFRFKSGATGVLELSWTLPAGGNLLEVYGTKGRIRAGFTEQPIELTRSIGKTMRVTYPKPGVRCKNSYQAFVDAVAGKAPSPTPGELGRDALAMCDAIAKSGATGRFVKVKSY